MRRRLHLAEHLPDRELLVEEESFGESCGNGHVACRNARRLSVTDKVDFATLVYGLLRRGGVCTRRGMFINCFDTDGARKEGAASYSLEPITLQ